MLPTGNTTSTGGVKMQKLRSSEDIHANSLFVIKRGGKFFFFESNLYSYSRWSKRSGNV